MYQFRFSIVENVTATANRIGRSFTQAGRNALGMAQRVDTSTAAVNRLNSRVSGLNSTFSRIAGLAAVGGVGVLVTQASMYVDRLYTSNALVAGIVRNTQTLATAQAQANGLADRLGISYLQSMEGLSKMLTLTKGNVTEAGKLTKLAQALAATNPTEGFDGALFALKEIEGGDTLSLRERFNIRIPTQEEAKKIAAKDGRTIQQVMLDSLQSYLDSTYGGGGKGQGVEFLLNIKANTVTGQVQRIKNAFSTIFTPSLVSFAASFTEKIRGVADWVTQNKSAILGWSMVVGQLAIRAAALYGIFVGYNSIVTIWAALRVGVTMLNVGLFKTMFYASWGIGQFRALTIASGKWIYTTLVGTGQAIRGMLVYVGHLWATNALYYRMAASMIWAKIVSGQLWASMLAGITRWVGLLTLSNLKLVSHQALFYASWGVGQITQAVVALGAYVTTLNFASIGQAILNTIMLANPVGLVVAGVLALTAAFFGLYKLANWMFPNFFKGITEWFGKAWDWVYNNFIKRVADFFKWLGDITGISNSFSVNTETAPVENVGMLQSLGIDPNAPGVATPGKTPGLGVAKGLEANVQGDRSIKHFTINIAKQVEAMNFYTVKELSDIGSAVRREVEKLMLDAVNEVQYSS